ncbi:MAG: D-cysteine desulfhydrase family protein [Candidatus Hodarchaeales archaeon]|jgi:D-cysteine desulfhydrase
MKKFDLNSIPRTPLCVLPTPITKMKNLSKIVGANIFIKRDDLTGVAFGGNKNRKLEFLLADALAKKANVIITEGALQSNHCLQTAACASKVGLDCELVLSGSIENTISGNLLLNKILDTTLHIVKDASQRQKMMKERATSLEKMGKRVYLIPTGGSTDIGALGYINCVKEIQEFSKRKKINFHSIVIATGSGGTHAGFILGCKFYYPDCDVIGITVADNKQEMNDHVYRIIKDFQQSQALHFDEDEFKCTIYDNYFGPGYGVPTKEVIDTIKIVAKEEGIFLDPVYNGKAMVGLIDLFNKEILPQEGNYLFLHSGGGPSLFNYSKHFE